MSTQRPVRLARIARTIFLSLVALVAGQAHAKYTVTLSDATFQPASERDPKGYVHAFWKAGHLDGYSYNSVKIFLDGVYTTEIPPHADSGEIYIPVSAEIKPKTLKVCLAPLPYEACHTVNLKWK